MAPQIPTTISRKDITTTTSIHNSLFHYHLYNEKVILKAQMQDGRIFYVLHETDEPQWICHLTSPPTG